MRVQVSPVAFNERVKLQNVVERFLKSPLAGKADYVVVDDGSDDGTDAMLAGYAPRGVRTVRHDRRRGVGAAIRTAIDHARAAGCDVLVIMAGNDKDNPDEIPALLQPVLDGTADLVQGSRYLGRVGSGGDMPVYRKIATRIHPWLMSVFLGRRITDSTNGFRALRLALFNDARIDIRQSWLDAYELEPYLLFKSVRCGYRYREVFVTKVYPPRRLGYTKMKPVTGWWSILKPVFYLGLGLRQ